VDEMRESIAIAETINSIEAFYGYNNLSVLHELEGDMSAAMAAWQNGLRVAQRLGAQSNVRWARFTGTYWLYMRGDWDGAMRELDQLMDDPEIPADHYMRSSGYERRALMLVGRGDDAAALESADAGLEISRRSGDPQQLLPALGYAAYVRLQVGDFVGAREHADEILAMSEETIQGVAAALAATHLLAMLPFGLMPEYIRRLRRPHARRWVEGADRALAGDWAGAADQYRDMGLPTDEALARLRAAEDLAEAGRRAEADAQLRLALPFFRSLGASRYVARAEALLAATA
jgi:tetratricopeptide (TPR) repeat protein